MVKTHPMNPVSLERMNKRMLLLKRQQGEAKGTKGGQSREHMLAIRPPTPSAKHLLYGNVAADEQAQAEAALLDQHRHLRAERDGALVKSLASLNLVIARAWEWFLRVGRVAEATESGKVRWAPGLTMLLTLEEKRLRLANELLTTPKARREAGLPILPEDEAPTLDEYIQSRYGTTGQDAPQEAEGGDAPQ